MHYFLKCTYSEVCKSLIIRMLFGHYAWDLLTFFQDAFFPSPYKRNSVQLQMLDENSLEVATNSTVTLRNKMDTNPVIKREGNY